MFIKKIAWQMGNDFSADMECEHCGHVGKNDCGYNDGFYHTQVIPAMRCSQCGKNRAGEIEHTNVAVYPVAA
jgi:transcription elongation factor Elf1